MWSQVFCKRRSLQRLQKSYVDLLRTLNVDPYYALPLVWIVLLMISAHRKLVLHLNYCLWALTGKSPKQINPLIPSVHKIVKHMLKFVF